MLATVVLKNITASFDFNPHWHQWQLQRRGSPVLHPNVSDIAAATLDTGVSARRLATAINVRVSRMRKGAKKVPAAKNPFLSGETAASSPNVTDDHVAGSGIGSAKAMERHGWRVAYW